MDVTGPRIEQIPMLVSNEDQQKRSKCDKQMMVQCNENYQRPSWHKSNTKSSSWPVPKAEKDYSCADKENVDPRQPCKNIFNTHNQVMHLFSYTSLALLILKTTRINILKLNQIIL